MAALATGLFFALPAFAQGTHRSEPCSTHSLGFCEAQVNRYAAKVRRLQSAQAQTVRPSVNHALRLASVIYGIPYEALRAVAWCESKLYRYATNGSYRGVMQEGPMFERGPFGRAGFSVFDPYANVFTAAHTVAREGWSQWACKP